MEGILLKIHNILNLRCQKTIKNCWHFNKRTIDVMRYVDVIIPNSLIY